MFTRAASGGFDPLPYAQAGGLLSTHQTTKPVANPRMYVTLCLKNFHRGAPMFPLPHDCSQSEDPDVALVFGGFNRVPQIKLEANLNITSLQVISTSRGPYLCCLFERPAWSLDFLAGEASN